jgi:hypothetical protein
LKENGQIINLGSKTAIKVVPGVSKKTTILMKKNLHIFFSSTSLIALFYRIDLNYLLQEEVDGEDPTKNEVNLKKKKHSIFSHFLNFVNTATYLTRLSNH